MGEKIVGGILVFLMGCLIVLAVLMPFAAIHDSNAQATATALGTPKPTVKPLPPYIFAP